VAERQGRLRPPRREVGLALVMSMIISNNMLNEIWIFDLSRPLALFALTEYASKLWVLDVVVLAEALLDVSD
jgi:hypothetical protein